MDHNDEVIAKLKIALTVARIAIENGSPLTARIAANGPTVGETIERALSLESESQRIKVIPKYP